MPKKRTCEPFEEGSIGDIYRYFFGRLIHYKPELASLKDWQEMLFDVKNREITHWEVLKPFKMPGLFYAASNVKIQGIGHRDIPEGASLFVRQDSKNPNCIDVEVFAGQGRKDLNYALTSTEWGWVKLNCQDFERRGRKYRKAKDW